MTIEAQKIRVIEKVLKVGDEEMLSEIITFLQKSKYARHKKGSIYDFVGVLSKRDAANMIKVIQETCGRTN